MSNSTPLVLTPGIGRRLVCMLYEALLLIAVEMLAVGVYMIATQNRHAPAIEHGRNAFLFLVTAAYFIHFWTDSGHTLAMKTWRIKLVMPGFARLPIRAAALRFLLSWMWFLPALLGCYAYKLITGAELSKTGIGAAIAVGIGAWALTALLDKDRQFLHDKLIGTRLIQLPKAAKKASNAG